MFKTKDYSGMPVVLSKNTWDNHICIRHPEMKPYLKEVQETIEQPRIVAKSSISPESQIYFNRPLRRDLYMKVVVDILADNTGDVATALLQKDLQGAEIPGGIIYVDK